MTWLLRLYPREWRRRYGTEIEEVVESQPRSLQLVVDLLAGAVDAHVKPQALTHQLEQRAADARGGSEMTTRTRNCDSFANMSRKDVFVATSLTIGSALVVAAILLVGRNQVTEAIGISMFPGVLAVGSQSMLMRKHSRLARIVLIGGPFVILFLIGLVAGLIVSD